jgi:hypothetical protein
MKKNYITICSFVVMIYLFAVQLATAHGANHDVNPIFHDWKTYQQKGKEERESREFRRNAFKVGVAVLVIGGWIARRSKQNK